MMKNDNNYITLRDGSVVLSKDYAIQNPEKYFKSVYGGVFECTLEGTWMAIDHVDNCLKAINKTWDDVIRESAELDFGYCGYTETEDMEELIKLDEEYIKEKVFDVKAKQESLQIKLLNSGFKIEPDDMVNENGIICEDVWFEWIDDRIVYTIYYNVIHERMIMDENLNCLVRFDPGDLSWCCHDFGDEYTKNIDPKKFLSHRIVRAEKSPDMEIPRLGDHFRLGWLTGECVHKDNNYVYMLVTDNSFID